MGAPLRALLTIAACWIVGRAVWEFSASLTSPNDGLLMASDVPLFRSEPDLRQEVREKIDASGPRAGRLQMDQDRVITFASPSSNFRNWPSLTLSKREKFTELVSRTSNLDETDDNIFGSILPVSVGLQNSTSNPIPDPRRKILQPATGQKINPAGDRPEIKDASAWSLYAWSFIREGSNRTEISDLSPITGQGGQYGASQAGAILSYRFSGDVDREASFLVRATSALSESGEEEIAIGAKVKPLAAIPISIHAEQRMGLKSNNRNRGVAIYLAGGTNPVNILNHVKLETYGQVGYVLNDRNSYFFGGAATLQKELIRNDRKKVSVGTGIWTGGQRDLARVDVGPRLDIRFPVADTALRVSVDWRRRVAGNAEPGSGLAITLSSDF